MSINFNQLKKDAEEEIRREDYRALLEQLKSRIRANRAVPQLPEELHEPQVPMRLCSKTRMPCTRNCGTGYCKEYIL